LAELNNWDRLLQEFNSLPKLNISKSFLDVARISHLEVPCSNILAFYFDPNEEHGLGSLFIDTLGEIIGTDAVESENFIINREVYTHNGKFIDITIETDQLLIGIENKIFHTLNNDLDDYASSLDNWALPNELKTHKIILSIRRERVGSGFVNITYKSLIDKLRANLGQYMSTNSQKWALYLLDFLSSLERLGAGNMQFNKTDLFLIENADSIKLLADARVKLHKKLFEQLKRLQQEINKPTSCTKAWIWKEKVLAHEFTSAGRTIVFDMILNEKGWKLEMFGRHQSDDPQLEKVIPHIADFDAVKTKKKNSRRYSIYEAELNTEVTLVAENLQSILDRYAEAEKLAQKF